MTQEINKGYSAKEVANYFLSKHMDTGITPLKLQKLVYIAHGWHLGLYGKPLINDENAEAWQHGPVFPSLYHHFKDRGKLAINRLAEKVDAITSGRNKIVYKRTTPKIDSNDTNTAVFLDRIWEVYGDCSGLYLSGLCHQSGTPWDKINTIKKNIRKKNIRNAHINDRIIKEYYESLLKENQKSG